MKLLAIVCSKHLGNTMKLAETMAEVAPLTIADLKDAEKFNLDEYDIVGFAGGIYAGNHDKELFKFIEKLEKVPPYTFVFSTSATGNYQRQNKKLIKLLEEKRSTVLGSFGCRAWCKFFVFALCGGVNKGKPDKNDFDAAKAFIEQIMNKYEELKSVR